MSAWATPTTLKPKPRPGVVHRDLAIRFVLVFSFSTFDRNQVSPTLPCEGLTQRLSVSHGQTPRNAQLGRTPLGWTAQVS